MEVDITACSGNGIRVAPGDLFDFLTLPIVIAEYFPSVSI